MSLFARLAVLARSPQARRMARQAVDYARSPRGQAQIRRAVEYARSPEGQRRIAAVRQRVAARRVSRRPSRPTGR